MFLKKPIMNAPPTAFHVGQHYSNDEFHRALNVGNAGGVRPYLGGGGEVRRLVVTTSVPNARQMKENPYHDRVEGDILVYTGAGREGDQILAGVNKRIPQQLTVPFPIYGFVIIGSRRDQALGPKRWQFLGLLEYLRHYQENQVDSRGQARRVWLFEFRIHREPAIIPIDHDIAISTDVIATARGRDTTGVADREIAPIGVAAASGIDKERAREVEEIRGRLLAIPPEHFEHLVRDLLVHSGFERVSVTRYSQDGGIDVNAFAGGRMWPIRDLLVQVQAKRWLHTVGRKEVAELRGSLQPFARGAVVTTSHFSKAAIAEAQDTSKHPIVLVDGYQFASFVHSFDLKFE